MYAVIETGGKQYRVEVGTELAVELLDAEPGESITIDRVLLVADGAEASIGRPLVDGASVSAEVVRLDRADKVVSFKYRPKARRRVKKGHRQEQTILRVTDVVVYGRSAAEAVHKAEADAKSERQRLEEAAARQAAEDAALAARLAAKAAPKATEGTEGAEADAPKARPSRAKAAAKRTEAATAAEETAPATEPAPAEESAPAVTKKSNRAKATRAEPADAAEPGTQETSPATDASPAPKRSRTKKDE